MVPVHLEYSRKLPGSILSCFLPFGLYFSSLKACFSRIWKAMAGKNTSQPHSTLRLWANVESCRWKEIFSCRGGGSLHLSMVLRLSGRPTLSTFRRSSTTRCFVLGALLLSSVIVPASLLWRPLERSRSALLWSLVAREDHQSRRPGGEHCHKREQAARSERFRVDHRTSDLRQNSGAPQATLSGNGQVLHPKESEKR